MKNLTKSKEKKLKYKVVLKVLSQRWERQGETILKALQNLNLSWEQIKGKGTLTIYKGTKKHEHLMPMFRIRRMLSNKIVMIHWAKNLDKLLDWDNKSNLK